MLRELPAWVTSNAASVRREAELYRGMTPEERLVLVEFACQDAMTILTMQEDPRRTLDWVDPLPASSLAALARLRSACS